MKHIVASGSISVKNGVAYIVQDGGTVTIPRLILDSESCPFMFSVRQLSESWASLNLANKVPAEVTEYYFYFVGLVDKEPNGFELGVEGYKFEKPPGMDQATFNDMVEDLRILHTPKPEVN